MRAIKANTGATGELSSLRPLFVKFQELLDRPKGQQLTKDVVTNRKQMESRGLVK
eukprot:COSAG04_NODE_17331_length_472_cov_0.975871_1_plen_54_part_10